MKSGKDYIGAFIFFLPMRPIFISPSKGLYIDLFLVTHTKAVTFVFLTGLQPHCYGINWDTVATINQILTIILSENSCHGADIFLRHQSKGISRKTQHSWHSRAYSTKMPYTNYLHA